MTDSVVERFIDVASDKDALSLLSKPASIAEAVSFTATVKLETVFRPLFSATSFAGCVPKNCSTVAVLVTPLEVDPTVVFLEIDTELALETVFLSALPVPLTVFMAL